MVENDLVNLGTLEIRKKDLIQDKNETQVAGVEKERLSFYNTALSQNDILGPATRSQRGIGEVAKKYRKVLQITLSSHQ